MVHEQRQADQLVFARQNIGGRTDLKDINPGGEQPLVGFGDIALFLGVVDRDVVQAKNFWLGFSIAT